MSSPGEQDHDRSTMILSIFDIWLDVCAETPGAQCLHNTA
jgi:hypothetical protein